MLGKMPYRLALDVGSTSIGWCLVRLDAAGAPCAVIRAGVRIFSDGRNPKDGSSLAVTRRLARQMRRRRDRLLKRKARLLEALQRLGFWPSDTEQRRALAAFDPYVLRKRGLDEALSPAEFGRALFHLNQRRGFQSNRKTDKKDSDRGLLKSAIRRLHQELTAQGARTVGEWLAGRHARREGVRARLRGHSAKDRAYDLYIDRSMIAAEFDALWRAQAARNPAFFSDEKRDELRDIIFHQRALKPVRPGRCTLLPDEERAPLALPSTQRFRIYQELNHLRVVSAPAMEERTLTLTERDALAQLLATGDLTFTRARKALGLPGTTSFNLEDIKRDRLKGNATAKALADPNLFGEAWQRLPLHEQEEIVERLLSDPSEAVLVAWLADRFGVDEARAERIADVGLPEGFGNLSRKAIARVLPALEREVVSYADAVKAAGFDTHSALSHFEQTGELFERMPYYGEVLQRHVGFADPKAQPDDPPERRFGRIANPTVHIGLNELRKVVNGLLARYGHPTEVVVEVARELKQSRAQREEEQKRQAERQRVNETLRAKIASLPGREGQPVSSQDLTLLRLWEELNPADPANRRCPYTGEQIGMAMLFSPEVEVEHILPFSMTLDDSLNNKTVALRRANREKGNRTPFDAFGHSPQGYDYEAILQRAALMPKEKAKRFAPDGLQRWLREDKDFLARALNDTAYLSRVAKEYLSTICPANRVRVVPGRLTAMLRGKFGLNTVLGASGEKNRDDHRHHAVDAAVIAVTDQGLLQAFARASAYAREKGLARLVETMPLPWPTYREHVARAVNGIWVSHKPDHGFEGALHNATAYGLLGNGEVVHRVMLDDFRSADELRKSRLADTALQSWLLERTNGLAGKAFSERLATLQRERGVRRVRVIEKLAVLGICGASASHRHGIDAQGNAVPYKGYKGDSNYGIEVWRDDRGRWQGTVISTFDAHRVVRDHGGGDAGWQRLRHPSLAQNGRPLVMRITKGDCIRLSLGEREPLMLVLTVSKNGQIFMAEHFESNVDARNRDKDSGFKYVSKMPGSLQAARARRVTVSPCGEVRDPGFAG